MTSEIYESDGRIVYDVVGGEEALTIATKCVFTRKRLWARAVPDEMNVRIAAAGVDLEITRLEILNHVYGVTSIQVNGATIRIADSGIFVNFADTGVDRYDLMLLVAKRRRVHLRSNGGQSYTLTEERGMRPLAANSKPARKRKPRAKKQAPESAQVFTYDEAEL
jgi:hypothetical protein